MHEPTSAPEMRILGGLSGSIDEFAINPQAAAELTNGYNAPYEDFNRFRPYTNNRSQGTTSTSSTSSSSSSTPRPANVKSLQPLISNLSLGGTERQDSPIQQDSPQSPDLPRHLRVVMERIPRLNLTGKLIISTSISDASGGACDVFIGNIADGYSIDGTQALKFAVKRIRTHINYDTDFSRVMPSLISFTKSLNAYFVQYIAREIYIWSKLKHKNVLHFVGYIQDGEYPCLVSE